LERALAIQLKAYGEDHLLTGNSLQSLGELWWRSGDPARALPYLQRGIAVREKALPAGSPELAVDDMTLGAVLRDLGRHKEAEPYLQRAIALAELGTTRTPVTVAEAAAEYAKLLRATGREADAHAVEERARGAKAH